MTVECADRGGAKLNCVCGMSQPQHFAHRTCSGLLPEHNPPHECHPRVCPEDPSCRILRTPQVYDAMRSYWTYTLASKPRGTLYIGVTNGLIFRVEQHRAGKGSAFTRKYGVHMLVWFEEFADVRQAIQREDPQTLHAPQQPTCSTAFSMSSILVMSLTVAASARVDRTPSQPFCSRRTSRITSPTTVGKSLRKLATSAFTSPTSDFTPRTSAFRP